MAKSIQPKRLSGSFEIYQPLLDWHVLLSASSDTPVAGKFNHTGTLNFVKVIIVNSDAEADAKEAEAAAWTEPDPPPAGWQTCIVDTLGAFQHSEVPVTAPTPADTDRIALFWGRVGTSDSVFERVPFTAVLNSDGHLVSAEACIWFFGTDPAAIQGPYGEDSASAPTAVPVPAGKTSVEITASGAWRKNGGGPHYGPYGNPADHNALVPCNNGNCAQWYDLQATPGGHPVTKEDLNKGCLVAVWNAPEGTVFTQHAVGEQWTGDIPGGATTLYLGFHDGFQWNNNQGTVRAYVHFK